MLRAGGVPLWDVPTPPLIHYNLGLCFDGGTLLPILAPNGRPCLGGLGLIVCPTQMGWALREFSSRKLLAGSCFRSLENTVT